jgi:hypothetical protein
VANGVPPIVERVLELGSAWRKRCRLHGGFSTGPRTPEGKARTVAAMVEGRRRLLEKLRAEGKPVPWAAVRGYALANRGHDTRALQAYLGHRNIQHTVRYTELSPTRFKNFWRE